MKNEPNFIFDNEAYSNESNVDLYIQKKIEGLLRDFVEKVSYNTGYDFFEELVLYITKRFNVDFAFIGEISDTNDKIKIIAKSSFGEIFNNLDYTIKGTPTEQVVIEKKPFYCGSGVKGFFPDNEVIKELESYIGIPLVSSKDQVIGIIVVMHSKPIRDLDYVSSFFHILAQRAGVELERIQNEVKLIHMAFHDNRTGLPNNRLFNDRLNLAIKRAVNTKKMMAVLYLDLDRLKLINDTLGHDIGDKLLFNFAQLLIKCTSPNNTTARLGGDEFAILIPSVREESEATSLAEKIINNIQQPWNIEGQELFITTSIGISIFPKDGEDANTLLKHADVAMYRAKEEGRNNYQLYTEDLKDKNFEILTMKNNLSYALKEEEFVIYYQPKVNVDTMQVIGVEALIRWKHPEFGIIPPSEFIHIAEDSWLIVPMGEWMLRNACIQNKAWQVAGLKPIPISVNISLRHFQQHNFIRQVERILEETGLDPQWLELEITEGIAAQNVDLTIRTLSELRKMGIQIAIDDFGKGYSSLMYLKKFPINTLKIDQIFICEITEENNEAAIAAAIIAMANSLKLEVIAEGVESEEQIKFLRQHQCNKVQGYYFSKPVPSEIFEKLLFNPRLITDKN